MGPVKLISHLKILISFITSSNHCILVFYHPYTNIWEASIVQVKEIIVWNYIYCQGEKPT